MPGKKEPNENALKAEIVRLNKIIQALMNRAERNASIPGSDYTLFHTAITLEDQIRRRTEELEAALTQNEKITRALRESENRIRNLAFYDSLTQLPNRRLLNDRLEQALAATKRSNCYGAVMFLDLDNFKLLNDTQGHGLGDLLLIEVAHRLIGCLREIDTIARFGGDEFVVIINDLNGNKELSIAQTSQIADKICITLAEPYIMTGKSATAEDFTIEHRCTASIGVVLFNNEGVHQEDILKWADSAMYEAKAKGGNTFFFKRS